MAETATLAPRCVVDPAACDQFPEDRRPEGHGEACVEIQNMIVAAGGAGAIEQANGCPRRAATLLMHAAIDGDTTAIRIERNMGFDATPFTEAINSRYGGGA